jgi:hypothetical protein
MVLKGWAREYCNKQIKRVRGMFKWAVSHELVPVSVLEALRTVAALKRGRTDAPERPKIKPVQWSHVEATLPYLADPLPAMVRAHYLIGCRAEDICILCTADLQFNLEDGLWRWSPHTYKTEHHEGEALHYWIGPACQGVLRPILDATTDPHTPVFATLGKKGNGRRQGGYSTASYRRAITRGIERARAAGSQVEHWFPLQLRHARATEIRSKPWGGFSGAEAAQSVTKHRELKTTEIYADRSDELARRVMREMG